MKIAFLGAGTWGYALATLLAENGHQITAWTREKKMAEELEKTRLHPKLDCKKMSENVRFTDDLDQTLKGAEMIVESVTSSGIRPVFEEVFQRIGKGLPIVLTSKGIEPETSFLLPEVLCDLLAEAKSPLVGCISGPSHAEEVVKQLPTSIVASSYNPELTKAIISLFTTENFRIYPSEDLHGICFGGAMKNVIAIACGISDGLGFGDNTKAALMTRGLHEIRKLSQVKGCKSETLNGLSGLGDLCVSCLPLSRNYKFGHLLAKGYGFQEAKDQVGMVVEGAYAVKSTLELAMKFDVPVPITEATYKVVYEGFDPKKAVKDLLKRQIKMESL